eukprot:3451843-Pyramimonas_sp.AAC.1
MKPSPSHFTTTQCSHCCFDWELMLDQQSVFAPGSVYSTLSSKPILPLECSTLPPRFRRQVDVLLSGRVHARWHLVRAAVLSLLCLPLGRAASPRPGGRPLAQGGPLLQRCTCPCSSCRSR